MNAGQSLVLVFGLGLLVAPSACDRDSASTAAPNTASHTVLSLQAIHCQSCGMSVVQALEQTDGVFSAQFDRELAEVRVDYDSQRVGPDAFVALVEELGYRATEGAGQGAYTPEVEFPADLDVRQISRGGEDVDIEAHLVPGKVTVFDFHAAWCGPCRKVDRHMLAVLKDGDGVALRKLDVRDWDSEIAARYLGSVASLPYVIVYAPSGERVAEIVGLDLEQLDRALAKARRP